MKSKLLVLIPMLLYSTLLLSKDLHLYIEPRGEINYSYFHFPGLLNFGVKNVNKETIYPHADFSPYFNPGIFLKAEYGNIRFLTGIMLGNYLYSLSPDNFPFGFAYQYDGNGNYRYFLGDNFIPREEKIMYNIDSRDLYFKLDYKIYDNISLGFLYQNSLNEIRRSYKGRIQGVTIDTVGSYINHDHFMNSYYLTLSYNYHINIFHFTLQGDFAPYISYKIIYNHDNDQKIYDGYAYKVGGGIQWKWLFIQYFFSAYHTKSNLFYTQMHTIRFGFTWEALKLDIGKIDIFN